MFGSFENRVFFWFHFLLWNSPVKTYLSLLFFFLVLIFIFNTQKEKKVRMKTAYESNFLAFSFLANYVRWHFCKINENCGKRLRAYQ